MRRFVQHDRRRAQSEVVRAYKTTPTADAGRPPSRWPAREVGLNFVHEGRSRACLRPASRFRAGELAPYSARPDVYIQDPHKVLEDIVDRWIAADEAERAEKMINVTPAPESHTEAETVATPPEDDGVDGELA